jgi:hypothetical protein
LFDDNEKQFKSDPHGFILTPIFTKIEEKENQEIVGILLGVTPFGNLLDRLIPKNADGGIVAVFKDRCGNVMSFELSSSKALFLGYEDFHDDAFDKYMEVQESIEMYDEAYVDALCSLDLYLYPTESLKETYTSNSVGVYIAIVGIGFALVVLFVIYDYTVTTRQNKTMQSALKTRAIVASLFPERIARKLVQEAEEAGDDKRKPKAFLNTKAKLENFMTGDMASKGGMNNMNSKPLAELFPEATVMFGDLVGM